MPSTERMLSELDIKILSIIGHNTIRNIVCLTVEAVLYTIYSTLVMLCGRIYIKRQRWNVISTVLFAVILTMFLLDTALCIIDMNDAIREISSTLLSTAPNTLAERLDDLTQLWPVENVIYSFLMNLGDVVICWRTYAFYRHSRERWLLLIPFTFLAGSFAISSLIAFCVSRGDPEGEESVDIPFCGHTQMASYTMTLATTVVITAMIGWKTWMYRRTIGAAIRSGNAKTRIERVLEILTESGLLYLAFCLATVINHTSVVAPLEDATPRLAFGSAIWAYMTSHIICMYPALVIIMVDKQSYIDSATTRSRSKVSPSQASGQRTVDSTRSQLPHWDINSLGSLHKDGHTYAKYGNVAVIGGHELREMHGERTAVV
ncbi:unnamed protein product [Peniophora sp. CBMAI 1063]|nr:unnamed protein product [Peniophora sp. CBMAI 1063]